MADKTDTFDLVVIGGGPGGYVGAIRAAQLGLKVACVEKRAGLGGTCLNVGCIPSKALLHSSELYEHARHGLAAHGIATRDVALDLAAMMQRKSGVVADLVKGIDFLFKKNKITRIAGTGRIAGAGHIEVAGEGDARRALAAKSIIIATGSEPASPQGLDIDERRIVSSTGALSLEAVPDHLVVVGGGYIGLEMGTVWRRLGAKVTVIEYLERIVPGMDGEVATQFQRILKKQGIVFRLGTKVTGARADGAGVELSLAPAAGGDDETMAADIVLVAVGRRPYTNGLGLETVGLKTDNAGRIPVDRHFRTTAEGIYAIGDVIAGPMLAHKAEEEGVACAEIIAGKPGHVNYDAIPAVVYTHPEVASVGRTEEELKDAGIDYKAGKFPLSANSRARTTGDTDGFVKILADAATDRVLGVHIVGREAGTLIAEAVMAMEFGAAAEDIARTCHAHPTLGEALKEAALAIDKRALHA